MEPRHAIGHRTLATQVLNPTGRRHFGWARDSATRQRVAGHHCTVQRATMCNRSLKAELSASACARELLGRRTRWGPRPFAKGGAQTRPTKPFFAKPPSTLRPFSPPLPPSLPPSSPTPSTHPPRPGRPRTLPPFAKGGTRRKESRAVFLGVPGVLPRGSLGGVLRGVQYPKCGVPFDGGTKGGSPKGGGPHKMVLWSPNAHLGGPWF